MAGETDDFADTRGMGGRPPFESKDPALKLPAADRAVARGPPHARKYRFGEVALRCYRSFREKNFTGP